MGTGLTLEQQRGGLDARSGATEAFNSSSLLSFLHVLLLCSSTSLSFSSFFLDFAQQQGRSGKGQQQGWSE
jgi:hypothetical protein